MLHDALLVAGKDLRLEMRSRVGVNQVLPLAVLILVLFAFALDPDRGVLRAATPGLFWVAVLFSSVMAVQRAFATEAVDGVRDALRLSGLEPAGIFLGKAAALAVQLLVLEALLLLGVIVLYGTSLSGWGVGSWALLVLSCLLATVGIATAGSLYGVLAAGLRVRETLLPLLLLPVLAPLLIACTRAFEAALDAQAGEGWRWVGLLTVFCLVYIVVGAFGFGPLLEES